MNDFASALIEALGGSTAVARMMEAPVSTVNNMRTRRLTRSRLNHLRRIARDEKPSVDVEALALRHGVELPSMRAADEPSPGTSDDISQRVAA